MTIATLNNNLVALREKQDEHEQNLQSIETACTARDNARAREKLASKREYICQTKANEDMHRQVVADLTLKIDRQARRVAQLEAENQLLLSEKHSLTASVASDTCVPLPLSLCRDELNEPEQFIPMENQCPDIDLPVFTEVNFESEVSYYLSMHVLICF